MKKLLTIILFLLSGFVRTFAQGGDYKELLALYVDEKYEKLLYKAEKYTLDDKTKKDAMPYLFMSMGYYKISKLDEFKKDYPDAFKNALKYMGKYAQKDKGRTFAAEYEDYFEELRTATVSEAEVMLDQKKYTKAKTMYDNLTDMDPNDAGAYLMLSITFEAIKSKKEAATSLAKAKELLTTKKCSTSSKQEFNLLKNALMTYANHLSEAGSKAEAKEWMDLGMDYFKDDKEYMVNYEIIGE
ncbi:MAG: hypothetical protein IT223_09475 [Crocinitomicaceae bacterium]|nr:hypothetical protein [Crocinitomicaceae bacterium]